MKGMYPLRIGDLQIDILCDDFVQTSPFSSTPLHNHRYGEIHVLTSGEAAYVVDNKKYRFVKGDVLIIPPKTFHSHAALQENATFVACAVKAPICDFNSMHLSDDALHGFVRAVDRSAKQGDVAPFAAYLHLFLVELLAHTARPAARPIDYGYLLYEYFGLHYNRDIHLNDIAAYLHLSPKQAQRIIQRETGHTFLQELTQRRMQTAEYLMHNTEMSANQIAQYVGYATYAGFWKAWKKYAHHEK